MVQTAGSMEAASLPNTQPGQGMFLRPFVSRTSTQRHCDHLEKLQPVQCSPRERKIECCDVSAFLEAAFSERTIYGYWGVDGQLSEELTWTTIVCCDTFELLVQCPPGKRITLGNLDLAVILESCLEDAKGGPFIRKVTSTSKCWPTGHVNFRWLLQGTLAEGGPGPDAKGSSPPPVQRSNSVRKLLSPIKHLKLAQLPERKRTMSIEQLQSPTSPVTASGLQRWDSARRQSLEPSGGICASPTRKSLEGRRSSSWKERTSSLFQSKRHSHNSTSSQSTSSSSSNSKSTVTGVLDMSWYRPYM